jgi:hypothetical protein
MPAATSFINASSATSGTLSSPTNTKVDDLLLFMESILGNTPNPTLKSGWTNIANNTVVNGNMAYRMSYRIATGSDSVSLPGGTGCNGVMLAYRNAALDIFTATANGDPLSAVTTSGLRWIVVFADAINANPSDNSGYTNRANSLANSVYRIKAWDTNGKKVAGTYDYDLTAVGSGAGGVIIAVKDRPFIGWGRPL